jgi:hypothetical protein
MRPYLAILKDSFREAMVSRVLWVLLVLATLMLAAILPVSLEEQVAYRFDDRTIRDATALAQQMKAEHDGQQSAPGKQVWKLLDGETKKRFEAAGNEGGDRANLRALEVRQEVQHNDEHEVHRPFWDDLNRLLEKGDLWDAEAWAETELPVEAQELIDRGPQSLSEEKLGRLNRLLLEAAYSSQIAGSQTTFLQFAYFGMEPGGPFPSTKDGMLKMWLAILTDKVAGVLGVVIAIMVTSSIIPQTFEAGAIDLLLSKPISRPLVFLTKFFGGCAFILLISAYFLGGLWLIAGLRFGHWSSSVLVCIPLLMFLFAVYYSVSALSGMIWKNAIVAVVFSVVFWFACIGTWGIKSIFDAKFSSNEITRVVDTADGLYVVRGSGVYRWDEAEMSWELAPEGGLPKSAPVGTVLQSRGSQLSFAGGDDKVIDIAQQGVLESHGVSARSAGNANTEHTEGRQHTKQDAGNEPSPDDPSSPRELTKSLSLTSPFVAAMDPQNSNLVTYDRGRLLKLDRDESGDYEITRTIDVQSDQLGLVAMAGSTVLLALADGRILLYDADTLELRSEFQPEGSSPPMMTRASADGRYFAVLFHHRVLWLYDTQEPQAVGGISHQGNIAAVGFGEDNQLLLAHDFSELTRYSLPSLSEEERHSPELDTFGQVYWYGIQVVYRVFPKPGELGDLVTYLVSGSKSKPWMGPPADLQFRFAYTKLNIWQPLWSNLAFMVVMLTLGCWYVQRKDF